ncbi:hypothetical protein Tco_0598740 [Tanacetum coccineum]
MVAYLKKPEGSEGFHQIVNFLNANKVRYALIENPTIYVSLIKPFWETATAKTLDNGEIKLTATIDGKVKIVTEASVRRYLQLADYDGYGPKPSKSVSEDITNEVRESLDAPLVEELVSDDKLEKKIVFPTVAKMNHNLLVMLERKMMKVTNVNTGSLNINTVSPIVTTALLEATHADFYGDETEIDMSNITTTYLVPSTPITRLQ